MGTRAGLIAIMAAGVASAGEARGQDRATPPVRTETSVRQADVPPAGDPADTVPPDVVVTGTASKALNVLDTGFSITTADLQDIRDKAPTSTADLLNLVPGVTVEATGGTSGANVFVRGFPQSADAPFLTISLDGAPIFPAPTLSFLENSTIFRLDDMVERVEVLRGGPSPVLSNGQAGVTANFIQRKGTPDLHGGAKVTLGTEGSYRFDGYLTGPVDRDTRYSIGGFYRVSDGLRHTQFPADKGGQIVGTITHDIGNRGTITAYGRYARDRNAFYSGVPLVARDGGRTIAPLPGFDPLRDTLLGDDVRRLTLEVAPGRPPRTASRDVTDGRGIDILTGGLTIEFHPGDWTITNRANFLTGNVDTRGLFTGANPLSLRTFIAASIAGANTNPAVRGAAGRAATAGSASYVTGGGVADPDQLVLPVGFWSVDKRVRSITDELRVSRALFAGNTLTLGGYFAKYSSDDLWYLGNNLLLTATPNARRVDVRLDNGVAVTRDGFVSSAALPVNARNDGRNLAGFLVDEWKLSDSLNLDIGGRVEHQTLDSLVENTSVPVNLDGNPLTLYNNSAVQLNGTYRRIRYDETQFSWTGGATYFLTPRLSVFGRVNSGYKFPQFDNLRGGQSNIQTVDQYELGVKTVQRGFNLFVSGFANDFGGLIFTRIILDPAGNPTFVNEVGGSRAKGVEFEGEIKPLAGVSIGIRGTYQDAKYRNFGANTGNRVARQPRLQFSIAPAYRTKTDLGQLRVFASYNHFGRRFGDIENAQRLPRYYSLDGGIALNLESGVEILLTGSNLTDKFGLTDGNPQLAGPTTGTFFTARPVFGRRAALAVGFAF